MWVYVFPSEVPKRTPSQSLAHWNLGLEALPAAPPGAFWRSGAGYSRSSPAFSVWRIQRNARRDAVLAGVFPELQPLRTRVLHSHTL